ncbi:hypothetical protein ACFY1B_15165 [Streptomyces mirabilis]|uniref:hypothetical protein n=1 Tax=Streptomyces mirabilis TaxID=68239 RepID=UPI003682FB0D
MQYKTTRTARLLVSLALLSAGAGAVTGCGSERAAGSGVEAPGTGQEPRAESRARQVADAWDGSEAARQWRRGYHPMADAVQLPEGGPRDKADQRAFTTQSFVLRGALPALPPKNGEVRWKSGASLTLPLMEPREAYEKVAARRERRPAPDRDRGEAGRDDPGHQPGPGDRSGLAVHPGGLRHSAQARCRPPPPKLPESPIGPSRDVPAGTLVPLGRLVEVAGDCRSVTVLADHGSCDSGPAVHVRETRTRVVLSASVLGARKGPCTGETIRARVTVRLTRPLGDRILLDAHTGRPVPHEGPHEASPSWS